MSGRHGRERNAAPLRDVYVARTVNTPQPKMQDFLDRVAKTAGRIAEIRTVGSTHITFLETAGVKEQFRQEGFTSADVRAFKGDLELHLRDAGGDETASERRVRIDRTEPLKWRGYRDSKLALNIIPDDAMLEEREHIEGFLEERFGCVPHMKSFDPHITIGRVNPTALTIEQRRDPLKYISRDVCFPETVALNGLMVYLDRIPTEQ